MKPKDVLSGGWKGYVIVHNLTRGALRIFLREKKNGDPDVHIAARAVKLFKGTGRQNDVFSLIETPEYKSPKAEMLSKLDVTSVKIGQSVILWGSKAAT